jgi:hypothetical protein
MSEREEDFKMKGREFRAAAGISWRAPRESQLPFLGAAMRFRDGFFELGGSPRESEPKLYAACIVQSPDVG